MGGLGLAKRLLVQGVQSSVQGREEADRGLGRFHTVFPERELIKLPYAVPVVLPQRVEELKGLHQVNRADDHVVVPTAEVVVDINSEEPASINAQLRSVGGCLQAVYGMAEVQQDAQIVQSDLLNGDQGTGGIREDDLVTRLARFVFDHKLDLRVSPDQLAQAIDGQLPDVVVIDLEGIVPAVLTEPELDVVAAQLLGQLGGLIQKFQGLGPNRRIRVGDRALDVVAVVDLRSDGDGPELVALEGGLDVVQAAVEVGERP